MLELEIQIKHSMLLENLLVASVEFFKKILNIDIVPSLELHVLDKGEIVTPAPEKVTSAGELYCEIAFSEISDATVSILFVNLDHLLPHIPLNEAGCWAVVGVENRNLFEYPLVCSIALALSEINGSCITDERSVWFENRETSHTEALKKVILTEPQNNLFDAATMFNQSLPGRKQGEL